MQEVVSILGIATEVPEKFCLQKDYATFITDNFDLTDKEKKVIHGMCSRSKINKRHTVIKDNFLKKETWDFLGQDFPISSPSTEIRNNIYKQEAPHLAASVSNKAIQDWGGDKKNITHVIFVSCTGLIAPGIEFLLIDMLGLNRDVGRFGINYMGCFGAFRGLAIAKAIANEDAKNKVLMVCVELCTLHIQTDKSLNTIISNLLFADGASAVIIGQGKGLWSIKNNQSIALENSLNDMTWEIGSHGFLMTLTSQIPQLVTNHLKSFVTTTSNGVSLEDCAWAIHPGGKAILQGIESACNLTQDSTKYSWEVLKNYGNMSSGSILFVLDAMRNDISNYENTLAFGFGPGLSMEGILLKNDF